MTVIGKLKQVPLRDLWAHEDRGFSAWLEKNLDSLSEALRVSLSDPQRGIKAGDFQVDLVADDENGNRVIIENQLEATDHDHLGKVLTYLTNLDAKAAIWITKEPRPEHVRAVQWLNETTPGDIAFFLVRLDAYRIGGSEPAPLFTVIVGPSEESKNFGTQKKELAERHVLRRTFWELLLARARKEGVMYHAHCSPSTANWIQVTAGAISGLYFVYVVWMTEEAAVELYIDTEDRDENKSIFDQLQKQKAVIEKSFGKPLSWERLDARRACRVRYVIREGGLIDGKEKWPRIQDSMISAMDLLAKALRPHLPKA
jgi:hypothetical protein